MTTGGRTCASRAREGARGPTALPEACGPPQPRGEIRTVEGWGIGCSGVRLLVPREKRKLECALDLPRKKLTSPPSLKALMSDPSLFEELPLEVPDEGAFSSMGEVYSREVVKEVR